MVFLQRLHPMAIKPSEDYVIVTATGPKLPYIHEKGILFECYKEISIPKNTRAVIETGWAIRLKNNQFATIESLHPSLTLSEKCLDLGFEGPLDVQATNPSEYSVTLNYGRSIFSLCIFEITAPTFTIVDDISNPYETEEADSTVTD